MRTEGKDVLNLLKVMCNLLQLMFVLLASMHACERALLRQLAHAGGCIHTCQVCIDGAVLHVATLLTP